MNQQLINVAVCACLLAGPFVANQSESSEDRNEKYVPARLPASFEDAAGHLEFPTRSDGGEYYLFCHAWIYSNGRVGSANCLDYDDFDVDRLRNAVNKLMGKTSLSPAIVEGKPEEVELYYRLQFNEPDRVRVYPNWGHDEDDYGKAYEAPQRYDFLNSYPQGCISFGAVSLTPIDEFGRVAGEPEFAPGVRPRGRTSRCIRNIRKRLINGKYIPAHLDGHPVPGTHVEIWQDWDDQLSLGLDRE